MIHIPTHRPPTHPGEMLLEEFLKPLQLSQQELASRLHIPTRQVSDIIHGRRGIAPGTALRLGRLFGNSPAFWMNLQQRWDLYHAQRVEAEILDRIEPISSGE